MFANSLIMAGTKREIRLVVVLDPEDARAITNIARKEKLTKSDCVRRLIRERARILRTVPEAAARAAG